MRVNLRLISPLIRDLTVFSCKDWRSEATRGRRQGEEFGSVGRLAAVSFTMLCAFLPEAMKVFTSTVLHTALRAVSTVCSHSCTHCCTRSSPFGSWSSQDLIGVSPEHRWPHRDIWTCFGMPHIESSCFSFCVPLL